jgi:hypothetical protein
MDFSPLFCSSWQYVKFERIVSRELKHFCISFEFQLCIVLKTTSVPHPIVSRSDKEKTFLDPVDNKRCKFPLEEKKSSILLSVVVPAYNEESRCVFDGF